MKEWLESVSANPLVIAAVVTTLLAIGFAIGASVAARARRVGRVASGVVLALLLLCLSVTFAAVSLGIRGYRSLTHEETAARVVVRPLLAQRFAAHFAFPDGREAVYTLAGDELYVDAHVLKWKWIANWLGLHTQYELDRVAGRYLDIEEERTRTRSIYSLAPDRQVDLFRLARSHAPMSRLVDAEYGSASFIVANRPATYEIRVSTTGLLIREVDATPLPGRVGATSL
jgi:hypothetical protein